MKVIAILENSITSGGGFNQALNAILQMKKICEDQYEFEVFTTASENIDYLEKLNLSAVIFSFSMFDKLLAKLGLGALWQTIQGRLKLVGSFERKLIKHDCDLVYFLTPSSFAASLQQLNYIATVWDTCHRDMPEFPEVREFNQLLIRDRNLKNYLSPAVVVLVDALSSSDSIAFRYGVDPSRLLPMPFAPSPLLDSGLAKSKEQVLAQYDLKSGYFFYPAQFWAHKNHIRILEACLILNKTGTRHTIVFAGGDQGNRIHVERFAERNGLSEQVRFLGFVPDVEMRGLYEGCRAVIMPTYFGPTNLPPLEAWMLGKPLVYSELFKEQAGDAAALVNPDDAASIADAMTACMNESYCEQLVKAGISRLRELNGFMAASEGELLAKLNQFEQRLHCWSEH